MYSTVLRQSTRYLRAFVSHPESRQLWTHSAKLPVTCCHNVLNQNTNKTVVFTPTRNKTKGKSKSEKKTQKAVDKMIDDIVEDEDDDTFDEVDIQNSQLNKFLSGKGGNPSGGKKGGKGAANIQKLPYSDFVQLVKGENLWRDMNNEVESLKKCYIQQFRVRSVSSLDDVPVELEGDTYPLNELATISKKDPKRLIIDVTAFPQATKSILEAIKESGMNLNPQQDGLFIFVTIPKVTKEHRQSLAEGAKKKMTDCKNGIRKIQNTYSKKIGEDELSEKILKDESRAALDTVKLISDHFQSQAESLCSTKTKELLG